MAKYMLRDEIAGDGCVLCLPMNECAGSYVYDRSGYGNHGAIHGATWQGSRPRNALKFGGETYVRVPDSESLRVETNNQFTVIAWANLEYCESPSFENFLVRKATSWNNGLGLSWSKEDDTVRLRICFTDGTRIYIGTVRQDGWAMYVGSYDGAIARFYLNGELISSQTPNKVIASTVGYPVYISKSDRRIKGLIGPVRIYNRALSADEVRDHFLGRYTDNSGLRLYLPMNEGAGSTVWDRSPYGNHGTLYNFPDTSAGYGDTHDSGWTRYGRYENGYLYFGGGYIDCGNGASVNITGDKLTMAAWINPAKQIVNNYIIGKYASETDSSYGMGITDETGKKLKYFVRTNIATFRLTPAYIMPLNTWTHYVVVYDGSTIKSYINGALFQSNAASGNLYQSSANLCVGTLSNDIGRFRGLIDSVQIYNRALSEEEIQALYRGARVLAQRNLAVIR